ncbi:hypothetical protein C7974DRAFT_2962 [Boeremia exigua]|uniref:uncharacterized protein n=1 Tax=Boeremia exigua TaxID=749465 RepID=UPI001E8E068A|nr:uncharacterized protein C7974DRAFT_2962 [Boeremia exigua]KAH6643670.1 hypothetical protein C7974DRAFT_2962 [Boeremia exigua]
MPLHLLGKKSWNVYNPANIARVKADEDAAQAREAAADQRTQELDAARRAALLRGRTPPPLPDDDDADDGKRKRERDHGHGGKRRKLRGEDDTDMDIRLAAALTAPRDGDAADAKLLKLRQPASDAPLTNYAGHIDLFPVDMKEALKREKNAEAEKEKRKKEQAFEDQYTMRFANAAGRDGLTKPWYAARHDASLAVDKRTPALDYPGHDDKDVWGNEDPRRRERQQARISSSDPFAFMQKAQTQLKKSKEDKKKWAHERKRELEELRDAQDSERDRERSRKHAHRRHRSRSRSQERKHSGTDRLSSQHDRPSRPSSRHDGRSPRPPRRLSRSPSCRRREA